MHRCVDWHIYIILPHLRLLVHVQHMSFWGRKAPGCWTKNKPWECIGPLGCHWEFLGPLVTWLGKGSSKTQGKKYRKPMRCKWRTVTVDSSSLGRVDICIYSTSICRDDTCSIFTQPNLCITSMRNLNPRIAHHVLRLFKKWWHIVSGWKNTHGSKSRGHLQLKFICRGFYY